MSTVVAAIAVGVGGALGSLARYGIEHAIAQRVTSTIPWWAYIVNTSGAFALGALSGYALRHDAPAAIILGIGTGFIGAYTVLAPINVDGPRLWLAGHRHRAAWVTIGGYSLAVAAATLGLWITDGI